MRNGPILPENHPLVPEPVRDKLKIRRLQRDLEVAELAANHYRKKSSFAKRLPFWLTVIWAVFITSAHFGLIGWVLSLWAGVLDFLHW